MTEVRTLMPRRLFAVTLGARDIQRQRSFYEGWGWQAQPYSNEQYAAFDLNGSNVAFFQAELLDEEAAPGEHAPGGWKGVTLAVAVPAREDVDTLWRAAVAAGATAVVAPVDRPWGGRSGYVADPEGNRWELLWAPPM